MAAVRIETLPARPVFPATMRWRDAAAVPGIGRPEFARLTPAERVVAFYLSRGLTNREIATTLGKSVCTVKNQVASCLGKLNVPRRGRLIALLH